MWWEAEESEEPFKWEEKPCDDIEGDECWTLVKGEHGATTGLPQ